MSISSATRRLNADHRRSKAVDPVSDANLLKAIAHTHSHAAFETLLSRYSQKTFYLAMNLTGSRNDAEDAVQEAMLAVWKKANQFDPDRGNVSKWISRIVTNAALNNRKKRIKINKRETQDEALEKTKTTATAAPISYERDELTVALQTALKSLRASDRQVLAMYFGAGLSQYEIADLLSLSQRSISERISRTLDKVRKHLTKAGQASAVSAALVNHFLKAPMADAELPASLQTNILAAVQRDPMTTPDTSPRHVTTRAKATFIFGALVLTAGLSSWALLTNHAIKPDGPAPKAFETTSYRFSDGSLQALRPSLGTWYSKMIPDISETGGMGCGEPGTELLLPIPEGPFSVAITTHAHRYLMFRHEGVILSFTDKAGAVLPHTVTKRKPMAQRENSTKANIEGFSKGNQFIYKVSSGKHAYVVKGNFSTAKKLRLFFKNTLVSSIEIRALQSNTLESISETPAKNNNDSNPVFVPYSSMDNRQIQFNALTRAPKNQAWNFTRIPEKVQIKGLHLHTSTGGINGTGILELNNGRLAFNVPLQLPIQIDCRIKVLPSTGNKKSDRITFFWSDTHTLATIFFKPLRPRQEWIQTRHYVTERYIHEFLSDDHESLTICEREKGAPFLNLKAQGRWQLDQIAWRSINPSELPNVKRYLEFFDKIPPGKRRGSYIIRGIPTQPSKKGVFMEFQNFNTTPETQLNIAK